MRNRPAIFRVYDDVGPTLRASATSCARQLRCEATCAKPGHAIAVQVAQIARMAIDRECPIEYDRIVVAQTYAKPFVLDYPRA